MPPSNWFSTRYHPDKNKDPGAEEKFVEIAHGVSLVASPTVLKLILDASVRGLVGFYRKKHVT